MDTRLLSNVLLAAAVFFYSLNLGPMMFESFTSDRTWAKNPPASFHMFLGPYAQKTAHYWRIVSPLALVTLVAALFLNWSVPGRAMWVLSAFVLYLGIQGATMAYFVPEQERLIAGAGSITSEVLKARANRWLFLNHFRNVAGVLAFAALLGALIAPGSQ